MKIISPVDNLSEAPLLIEAGADELYGGWIPAAWQEHYSLLSSLNQRTFAAAQLRSLDELAAVVDLAHAAGRTFSLTLNAPFYTDAQLSFILAYAEQVVAAGVDGIILADLGLLRHLRHRFPRLEYHASTLAHLMNSAAIEIYRQQGVRRVVLPRHLTVGEMAAVVAHAPQVRCDAFLLVGKCPNTEGLCTFHHSSPDRLWPCEIPYDIRPEAHDPSPALRKAIRRQGGWATTDRRHGCGLCAIPRLQAAGVYGLKLVGRGAPAAQKVRNVQLTREFLRLAAEGSDFAAYRRRARAAHRQRFGADCSPNVCYYPEFYETD